MQVLSSNPSSVTFHAKLLLVEPVVELLAEQENPSSIPALSKYGYKEVWLHKLSIKLFGASEATLAVPPIKIDVESNYCLKSKMS